MPSSLWESYQRPLGPHPSPVCERFCGHWWLTANSCILLWPTTISPTDAWEVTSCPPRRPPRSSSFQAAYAHTQSSGLWRRPVCGAGHSPAPRTITLKPHPCLALPRP